MSAKATRIANLEQSHTAVFSKVVSASKTLAQITTDFGLNPSKNADLLYVQHRLAVLVDEGLATASGVGTDKFGTPIGSYKLTP